MYNKKHIYTWLLTVPHLLQPLVLLQYTPELMVVHHGHIEESLRIRQLLSACIAFRQLVTVGIHETHSSVQIGTHRIGSVLIPVLDEVLQLCGRELKTEEVSAVPPSGSI